MRCQRQILDVCWCFHVSNAEVLQRSGLWTIDYILRHRRLFHVGRVARLDHRVSAHDALRLRWWIPTKAERPAGEDRQVALATSGSTKFRRMPTLYYYLRCGDLRSSGVTERSHGHSDYATTMMVVMMMMKDELCQKWRVKLIFLSTYSLSGT